MRTFITLLILIIGVTCMGKEVTQKKPHHTENGFKNTNPDYKEGGLTRFLSWQWENLFKKLPSKDPKDYNFEIVPNDGKKVSENKTDFSVTWIGHASTLIQLSGKNILADPIWSERSSPISFVGPKRIFPPGIPLDALPEIHVVLISHNHYDHLDLPTLLKLEKKFKPLFLVGLKNEKFLKGEGLSNVKEMDWWDETVVDNLKITFTPTQHFSARSIGDRNETLWGSFIVQDKQQTIYFAGDTAYFDGFKEIGNKFPNIKLAIMPIGAYEPRWVMKHVHLSPEQCIQAFLDLKATYMLPMHYQTFILTDEALDEPIKLTKESFKTANIDLKFLLDLKIGETYFLK